MRKFDFTPDPRVLLALTHTPMQPLDALCELIDNAIDSFSAAKIQGVSVENPIVTVELPTRTQLTSGSGKLRVTDNGPGMSAENAERAIKAGFSGNNPYDSLGLFGMGFNISTGKIGNRTVVMTTRRSDNVYLRTTIDLNAINRTKDYQLDVEEEQKGDESVFREGASGTIIEVDEWWPEGSANHGFVDKLVRYGMPKIRKELGRRYATLLRERRIQLIVNDEQCKPCEHCVWGSNRFVMNGNSQIPARIDFDQVLHTTRRCTECTAVVDDNMTECPQCGATTTRTIQERVHGWVGIQRFDDQVEFGIDLIRNGRAIRKGEKAAFFEFVDEFQTTIKDYPIDQQYGRIVGEVHLDFVPVDFMKTDFQRSSEEWQRSMEFLRGKTSLQPGRAGDTSNDSPVYKLFQGYRRVRKIGKGDMYMGVWDPIKRKAVRVSRELEQEYYKRFQAGEMGYYDDAEWWKLVESADQPPAPKYKECPECGGQNAEGAEECALCGYIFDGKACLNPDCRRTIPHSAVTCPHCGKSQIVEVAESWDCQVCRTRNAATDEVCATCGSKRDTPDPVSYETLMTCSMKDDDLSTATLAIVLANGDKSVPVDLETYATNRQMVSWKTKESTPVAVFKKIDKITVFVDKTHPLFLTYGIPIEQIVAYEVAKYIYDGNMSLATSPFHNLTLLSWEVIRERWDDQLKVDATTIIDDAKGLISEIAKRLQAAHGSELKDYADQMTDDQRKALTDEVAKTNMLFNFASLKESGAYVSYAPASFILTLYQADPDLFFDGVVWNVESIGVLDGFLDPASIAKANQSARDQYKISLECVVRFLEGHTRDDHDYLDFTRAAESFLRNHMVEHV